MAMIWLGRSNNVYSATVQMNSISRPTFCLRPELKSFLTYNLFQDYNLFWITIFYNLNTNLLPSPHSFLPSLNFSFYSLFHSSHASEYLPQNLFSFFFHSSFLSLLFLHFRSKSPCCCSSVPYPFLTFFLFSPLPQFLLDRSYIFMFPLPFFLFSVSSPQHYLSIYPFCSCTFYSTISLYILLHISLCLYIYIYYTQFFLICLD